MANVITGARMLISLIMLLCPANDPVFYVLYVLAGFTDMIDGTVARKTNTASEFGSRLDTAADFVFVAVCLIKLIPVMYIPVWIYVWTGMIAVIKLVNLVIGFVAKKQLVAEHTIMNKITGGMLFALPLACMMVDIKYYAPIVCLIAMFAAIEENYIIRKK